jgi:hypothetical protein
MFATAIGVMVLGVALMLWAYASQNCASLLGYLELSSVSKNALDRMTQQIRNATRVESCSSNTLVLVVPGKTGTNAHTMTFVYDVTNNLVRQILSKGPGNQESMTLLTGCTNFSFSAFQRTPVSNSFALYTSAWSTNTTKVVQMQWTCLRQITGEKSALEDQISAKVVLRNQ